MYPPALHDLATFRAAYLARGGALDAAAPGSGRVSRSRGTVAVLPIQGPIEQKASLFTLLMGGTSTEQATAWFRAALSDNDIKAIVLDIDSPGGSVYGIQELAAEIFAARGTKPIVAVANSLAASAAYWLGSQADEFVVTPSGEVGSIGIVAVHFDEGGAYEQLGIRPTIVTRGDRKADGNPYGPLSAEAREDMEQRMDVYYRQFVGAVARGRGVTGATVEEQFGQGRMFTADEARRRGMVDRVATLDDTLARLRPDAVTGPRAVRAAVEAPALARMWDIYLGRTG